MVERQCKEDNSQWVVQLQRLDVPDSSRPDSEHQTKTGKEWWRTVSPSQGLHRSETDEARERAKRFSTIPFPSLSHVLK